MKLHMIQRHSITFRFDAPCCDGYFKMLNCFQWFRGSQRSKETKDQRKKCVLKNHEKWELLAFLKITRNENCLWGKDRMWEEALQWWNCRYLSNGNEKARHWFSLYDHRYIVKLFLDRGADFEAGRSKWKETLLLWVCLGWHESVRLARSRLRYPCR